jgi:large subunit ribosomal protein L21
MYAVIETGGKQYRVQPGQVVDVENIEAKKGKVKFDRVLLYGDGDDVRVGTPTLPKATVTGELVGQVKGPKVLAFKKRRRKDSQTTRGHRQQYSRVRIDEIKVK